MTFEFNQIKIPASPGNGNLYRRTGFTLTEVVVSAVVFLAFCIPIIGLLSSTKYNQKRTSKRLCAMLITQSVIDEIRHNAEVYGSTNSRLITNFPNDFTISKTFTNFPEAEELLLLTVKVKWSEFNQKKETEMSTLISAKSNFYVFKK